MFVCNTKGICLRQAEVSYVLTYDMFRFSASMVHVHRNIEFMVKLHMYILGISGGASISELGIPISNKKE